MSKSRIEECQRQAAECLAKADVATNEIVRDQYTRLAETYLQLVEMELVRKRIRGAE